MKTREKILEKALQLFNSRGIEYVGLRELAKQLDMRVGNVTYYFATKDELVNAISVSLGESNTEILQNKESYDIGSFLNMLDRLFINHQKYRCLYLSVVHIMDQNKVISRRYKELQKNRVASLKSILQELISNKDLKELTVEELDFLTNNISVIIRFWISEAQITYKNLSSKKQRQHYIKIIAQLLKPYSSRRGVKEIQNYLLSFD